MADRCVDRITPKAKGCSQCLGSITFETLKKPSSVIQTDLFGDEIRTPTPALALAIKPKSKEVLSKNQLAFNRLTKKVIALRNQIEQTRTMMEAGLLVYAEKLAPVEKKLSDHQRQCTIMLLDFFKENTKLKPKDRALLRELIDQKLLYLLEPDDTVGERYEEAFEVLHGISFEEAEKENYQALKDEMSDMFSSSGVDIDLEDVDMTDEQGMKERIAEWREKIAEKEAAYRSTRKKTKKQLEAEAKAQELEKVRKQSLSSIYKQLAKALHPDLEQDEELRVQKEDLMKQLTVAYEAKDLHALLTLEMQWLHQSSDHIQQLSDEKLAIFNEVLREQVAELETEHYHTRHHPRFEPLQEFSTSSLSYMKIQMESEAMDHLETIESLRETIVALGGIDADKEIKAILSSYSKMKRSQFYRFDDEW